MLATYISLTACGTSKKLQASKTQVEQLKKDSIETHRKLNDKNTLTITKERPIKSKAASKPFPPLVVDKKFKSTYPSATEVTWTKVIPLIKFKNKSIRDYKANFIVQENKNIVIYSEKGDVIELREQILPEQLPQNIYTAINTKYPEGRILSTSTIKHSKTNGSYTAIIKPNAQTEEIEVILMENGTFIE